jgi:hypothetical protein
MPFPSDFIVRIRQYYSQNSGHNQGFGFESEPGSQQRAEVLNWSNQFLVPRVINKCQGPRRGSTLSFSMEATFCNFKHLAFRVQSIFQSTDKRECEIL